MPLPLPLIKYVRLKAARPCFLSLTLAASSTPPARITRGEVKSVPMSTAEQVPAGVKRMATLVMRDKLVSHINEAVRYLSFARAFGKVIGRLDLLASLLTEKYPLAVTSYAQILLASTYLQFLPVSSPSP